MLKEMIDLLEEIRLKPVTAPGLWFMA